MALLPLVPLDELPAPLAQALERGRGNRMLSTTVPVQVWAHRPELAQAWLQALDQIHSHGVLDERLRELVRLRIAGITTCKACNLARKSDDVSEDDIACLSSSDARFAPHEQAALRYAELFAADYMALDERVFDELRRWFSVPQVVELNMFCALMLAGGRMTYVQRAYED